MVAPVYIFGAGSSTSVKHCAEGGEASIVEVGVA
jgi:hypothetical protein